MPITPPAVGNVVTPIDFLAVSAQAQVVLSWTQVPLATTYYINRSTDNVTFTPIAQSASLSYNDASGTVGTIYYYTVQAATASASSLPTASLSGCSLKPGQTTVGNLILECQQRTDRVSSDNITTQEWISMIDKSHKELFDLIVEAYGSDYKVAVPYTWTTAQDQQLYPLPQDFYKLLGLEMALNSADSNSWVSLNQFEFSQRNLYSRPSQYTLSGVTNLRYRLNGDQLFIVPPPQQGQTLRGWYVPRPDQLVNLTDLIDGVSGWEDYIVVDVCIKALTKTEEAADIFLAQKAALFTRIQSITKSRNIGDPQHVSDTRRKNFSWNDPGDSNLGGF